MEQRQASRQGACEFAPNLIKPLHTPVDQLSVMNPSPEEFYEAWEEARLARYWREYGRADYFYHETLKLAPEDIKPESLAEVIEGMNQVQACLTEDQQALPYLRAVVREDPANSEKRFRLANTLWRLGCEEEAAREYEAALEHPEALCPECFRDCWNNIGWCLYRREEYAKALPCFERAAKIRSFSPTLQVSQSARLYENLMLVYVALAKQKEARGTTVDYISHFGRVPWPERHALRKLNIDADALYIEHCGHAV